MPVYLLQADENGPIKIGFTNGLATALGVSRKTINEHETGKAPIPKERWLAICCIFFAPDLKKQVDKGVT